MDWLICLIRIKVSMPQLMNNLNLSKISRIYKEVGTEKENLRVRFNKNRTNGR